MRTSIINADKAKKYRIFLKKIGRPMPRMLKSAVILIYATENLKFRIYTIYYVVSCMLKIQKLILRMVLCVCLL